MKVLVSGATGLVGGALVDYMEAARAEVWRLSRSAGPTGTVTWDPAAGQLPAAPLEGLDAVVHLAGESIAGGRWTADRKRRIRDSRVQGTRLLCERLAGLEAKPQVLVSASAVGYYGDRGDEICTEQSAPGTGFLAEVASEWEAATAPAAAAGIRVVNLRIGLVLSPSGGALKAMLPPFKFGLGGRVGSGRQWMSWISLDDLVRVLDRAVEDPGLEGPVNAVSGAVTNADFTRALGRTLRRPTVVPLPAFAVRLLLGEMGQALLLGSTRVEAGRLQGSDFEFTHVELDATLHELLHGPA